MHADSPPVVQALPFVLPSSEESPYQVDRTFKSILQSIQYAIRYGSIASERIHVCFVWDGFKALDTRLFGGSNAPGDMAARSDNPMFGSTDWDRMMDAQARAAETPSGPEGKQSPVGHFMQAVVKGKINETVQFDFELSVSAFIKSEELGSLDSIAVGLVGLCPRLRPQYMLCIGGSVELEPQSLDRLIGAMERDPNCGLVTGRVQPIVDGTCHMVLPVPAQHIAMGIYNNVVTQGLYFSAEVCDVCWHEGLPVFLPLWVLCMCVHMYVCVCDPVCVCVCMQPPPAVWAWCRRCARICFWSVWVVWRSSAQSPHPATHSKHSSLKVVRGTGGRGFHSCLCSQ